MWPHGGKFDVVTFDVPGSNDPSALVWDPDGICAQVIFYENISTDWHALAKSDKKGMVMDALDDLYKKLRQKLGVVLSPCMSHHSLAFVGILLMTRLKKVSSTLDREVDWKPQ